MEGDLATFSSAEFFGTPMAHKWFVVGSEKGVVWCKSEGGGGGSAMWGNNEVRLDLPEGGEKGAKGLKQPRENTQYGTEKKVEAHQKLLRGSATQEQPKREMESVTRGKGETKKGEEG